MIATCTYRVCCNFNRNFQQTQIQNLHLKCCAMSFSDQDRQGQEVGRHEEDMQTSA